MPYTAKLYIVFQRQDGKLGRRIIDTQTIDAPDLNAAKRKATHYARKHPKTEKWATLAKTALTKWSPITEENGVSYVKKTFRTTPKDAEPNIFATEVRVYIT